MFIYDPKEVGERKIGTSSVLLEEFIMFDKQAQRMRAVNQAQALAKLGVPAPVLPPIPAPAPRPAVARRTTSVKPVVDQRGCEINIGDTIVYSTYKGATLYTARVIGFSQSKKSVKIMAKPYSWRPEAEVYKSVNRILRLA